MTHIVIIGSGFAGCSAVRALRANGHKGKITLVSPQAELFYFPSLIWVASGQRQESDLRINLHAFFDQHHVDHCAARVTGLDKNENRLSTSAGDIDYDFLIIASGGRYLRKLPGIEHSFIACSGWQDTHAWASRLNKLKQGKLAFGFAGNPKEPSAMRGGPVFEFLFGTDTWLRQQGRRDDFELHFFSPAPRPGARMGEKAVDKLLGEMGKREIQTHLGHKMKSIDENSITTEGETFASDLTLFIPGMTGPDWASDSGLNLSDGGFFKADEYGRATDCDNIYIAGDAGSFPGPDWKPKQAHMADLQAAACARNIIERIKGNADRHQFKTELICIVDSLTDGILVYRDDNRAIQFKGKPFHWAKSFFEWNYLRPYRR